MLYVWTRHAEDGDGNDCKYADDIYSRRCRCPKWLSGTLNGERYRKSAKTRSWEKAEELRKKLEESPEEVGRITVEQAVKEYLQTSKDTGNSDGTFIRKRFIFERSFVPWAAAAGHKFISDIKTPEYRAWRSTWGIGSLTANKRQSTVSGFFIWCVGQEWVKKNPVKEAGKIKTKQVPTQPFTRDQYQAILDATHRLQGDRWGNVGPHASRIRALTLLMRWSGLSIGDAWTLEKARLTGDKLFLYRGKTGAPVSVLLPPDVAEALRQVPPGRSPHPAYFFWSAIGTKKIAAGNVRADYYRLFRLAAKEKPDVFADATRKSGSIRMHPHMFRDTFAVELLLADVALEKVSVLLGHESIKTTEKSYAPWVLARQVALEESVKKAWAN